MVSSEGQVFGSRPPSPGLYTCGSTGAGSPSEGDSLDNRNISPGEFQLMNCLVGEIHLLHNWNANRSDCRLICSNLANLRTAPSGWKLGWLRGSASHGERGGPCQGSTGRQVGSRGHPAGSAWSQASCFHGGGRCFQDSDSRLWVSGTLGWAIFNHSKDPGFASCVALGLGSYRHITQPACMYTGTHASSVTSPLILCWTPRCSLGPLRSGSSHTITGTQNY